MYRKESNELGNYFSEEVIELIVICSFISAPQCFGTVLGLEDDKENLA